MLAALIPIITLAVERPRPVDVRRRVRRSTTTRSRSRASSSSSTYITILLSVDYIGEGDYYKGEFYFLLLTSAFGMSDHGVGPRPHHAVRRARDDLDPHLHPRRRSASTTACSNEAGVKYYLIGVLSSARDALRHVADLRRHRIDEARRDLGATSARTATDRAAHGRDLPLARRLRVQGRARCRSTSGRPTPTTARRPRSPRSSRSRRRPAGSSRCINIIFFGFYGTDGSGAHAWWGAVWVLAALSMTFGNLAALRQTNIVRMLAYSSIAQGGFMLVPFAAAGIAGADGNLGVAADGDRRGRDLPARSTAR